MFGGSGVSDILVAGTDVTVTGNSMAGGDIDGTGSTNVIVMSNINVGTLTTGTDTIDNAGDTPPGGALGDYNS
jgi:enolase